MLGECNCKLLTLQWYVHQSMMEQMHDVAGNMQCQQVQANTLSASVHQQMCALSFASSPYTCCISTIHMVVL